MSNQINKQDIIRNVNTVKDLYNFLKEKIESDPDLYEDGLVAISTQYNKEIKEGALYSITVSVDPGMHIIFDLDQMGSC